MDAKDWLTTTEVADAIGCQPHHVRRITDEMVRREELTVLRCVRNRMVQRKDVEKVRRALVVKGWVEE